MAIVAGVALETRRQQGASMPMNIANDCVEAARQGCTIVGVVNDKAGIGANTILTDASLVYNVRQGERVMIATMTYALATINDAVHIEVGYTDQPNGAGSFTSLTAHRHITTGGAIAGFSTQAEVFACPRVASYRMGARSVTFRVTANDALAEVGLEWTGWIEKE
jgi:hypothetical protein